MHKEIMSVADENERQKTGLQAGSSMSKTLGGAEQPTTIQ